MSLFHFSQSGRSFHSNNEAIQELENEYSAQITGYYFLGIITGFLNWFVTGSFIILAVKERATNAKHLQYISGAHFFVFWTTNFVFDFLLYCIPGFTILIFLANVETLTAIESTTEGQFHYALLLLLFGWASIPWIYTFSFIFTSPFRSVTPTYSLFIIAIT